MSIKSVMPSSHLSSPSPPVPIPPTTEAEGGELGAATQGWQEGTELGVHDAALIQVQVLQGGRGPLDQDLQGLQAEAGQASP